MHSAIPENLKGIVDAPSFNSPSLRLTKFVTIGKEKNSGEKNENDWKKTEIDKVIGCYKRRNHLENEKCCLTIKNATELIAKLKSRLIVNQAGGILENAGLCLHRHFGYPYIPGSAVKGLARHAAWCEWNEEDDEAKKLDLAHKIADIFGYPTGEDSLDNMLQKSGQKDCRGAICFMPAEPIADAPLVTDIVTCHHKDYYKGALIEAYDTESPNPQFFPAVEKGAEFRFQLLPLKKNTDITTAKRWLIQAVTLHGVGAKTAAGYGWFEDLSTKLEEEAQRKAYEQAKNDEYDVILTAFKSLDGNEMFSEDEKSRYENIIKDFDAFKQKYQPSDATLQQIVDVCNRLKKRLPQLSPVDKMRETWDNQKNVENVLKLSELKKFSKQSPERQSAVISLLTNPTYTRGQEVLKKLKSGVKGFGDEQQKIIQAVKGVSK